MKTQICAGLLVGFCLAGCSAESPSTGAEDTIEVDAQPILAADGAGSARFAVEVTSTASGTDGTTATIKCTGVALTQHWILTAAHCVNGRYFGVDYNAQTTVILRQPTANSTTSEQVFSGNIAHYDFPGWKPENTLNPTFFTGIDVALIRLGSSGMNPQPAVYGRLYDDDANKLFDFLLQSGGIDVAGWGYGNFSTTSCTTSTPVPRHGIFSISGVGSTNGVMDIADATEDHNSSVCDGDSGGPWYRTFTKPGATSRDITFALTSTSPFGVNSRICSQRCDPPNTTFSMAGPATPSRIDWIIQTSALTSRPLTCTRYSINGFAYRTCTE